MTAVVKEKPQEYEPEDADDSKADDGIQARLFGRRSVEGKGDFMKASAPSEA